MKSDSHRFRLVSHTHQPIRCESTAASGAQQSLSAQKHNTWVQHGSITPSGKSAPRPSSDESGCNSFHTAHSSIFFTTELTVNEVFRRSAYEMVEARHAGNQSPDGFGWYTHAYELAAASTNAGQG
jgi:hypothetical protein